MTSEYMMPKLGHLQEVGTIVEWRKTPGEQVKKSDILLVVETEKTTVEVEAMFDGVLLEILLEPGVTVPVNTPIARIEEAA